MVPFAVVRAKPRHALRPVPHQRGAKSRGSLSRNGNQARPPSTSFHPPQDSVLPGFFHEIAPTRSSPNALAFRQSLRPLARHAHPRAHPNPPRILDRFAMPPSQSNLRISTQRRRQRKRPPEPQRQPQPNPNADPNAFANARKLNPNGDAHPNPPRRRSRTTRTNERTNERTRGRERANERGGANAPANEGARANEFDVAFATQNLQ